MISKVRDVLLIMVLLSFIIPLTLCVGGMGWCVYEAERQMESN